MTQLILDGVELPESIKGGYHPYREDLGTDLTMINGRMVKEVRGTVWRVSYQYGYFNDEMKNRIIEICERGRKLPITCDFLPQESSGPLMTSTFFVTSFTRPKFAWSSQKDPNAPPAPLWYDFAVELREVRPSD